jgi:hypothetical protein
MHRPGCPSVFGRHQGHAILARFSSIGWRCTTGSAYAITAADPRPDDFSQVLNRLHRPAGMRTNLSQVGTVIHGATCSTPGPVSTAGLLAAHHNDLLASGRILHSLPSVLYLPDDICSRREQFFQVREVQTAKVQCGRVLDRLTPVFGRRSATQ